MAYYVGGYVTGQKSKTYDMVDRECIECGQTFRIKFASRRETCDDCFEAKGIEQAAREAWRTRDSGMFRECRDGLD